ncbi:MAG: hypothetical protein BGP04_03275 [Rhizobiales bacterium 62-17]|nr:nuclear transport factor 2 family protein [Hyphomicrobiales bacterium]OJY04431.1 MAG: hypothetical protein BGP04_03275 [Rhizobiales bacterium 62-17]
MSRDHLIDQTPSARRDFLIAAATIGAVAAPAYAQEPPRDTNTLRGLDGADADILDSLRIADLVQRERTARDAGQWEEMAASYHPQSMVDVSWYHGDGAGFVAASRRNAASGRISLHQLGPTVTKVAGTRALAETPCQLLSFVPVDGIDVCMIGTVRLLWRVQKLDRRWLIAGLRMIYIRDLLLSCDPNRVPSINAAELDSYRRSYRFLSYVLARSPNRPRDDLPGIDRPELVEALRTGEKRWLEQA